MHNNLIHNNNSLEFIIKFFKKFIPYIDWKLEKLPIYIVIYKNIKIQVWIPKKHIIDIINGNVNFIQKINYIKYINLIFKQFENNYIYIIEQIVIKCIHNNIQLYQVKHNNTFDEFVLKIITPIENNINKISRDIFNYNFNIYEQVMIINKCINSALPLNSALSFNFSINEIGRLYLNQKSREDLYKESRTDLNHKSRKDLYEEIRLGSSSGTILISDTELKTLQLELKNKLLKNNPIEKTYKKLYKKILHDNFHTVLNDILNDIDTDNCNKSSANIVITIKEYINLKHHFTNFIKNSNKSLLGNIDLNSSTGSSTSSSLSGSLNS